MDDFKEFLKIIAWVIVVVVAVAFIGSWLHGLDEKACKDKFGQEWSHNTRNTRGGAPQCINEQGDGKYLN